MGKRTRIVLYALSLVTMLAMVTLIIFSHGRQSGEPAKDVLSETDISSTEEPVQIPEAEESEETEAADGQNRIQNDTEQEEADIAGGETDKQAEAGNTEGDGSTTLIFAGDVLFANAFKSNYDAGGIEKVIEPQLLQELQDADIFMVNNEFPFSNRGEPMEDKQFTFCCDPKYVKALNEMGVDMHRTHMAAASVRRADRRRRHAAALFERCAARLRPPAAVDRRRRALRALLSAPLDAPLPAGMPRLKPVPKHEND